MTLEFTVPNYPYLLFGSGSSYKNILSCCFSLNDVSCIPVIGLGHVYCSNELGTATLTLAAIGALPPSLGWVSGLVTPFSHFRPLCDVLP